MTLILILTAVGAIGFGTTLFLMRNQPKGLYVLFFAEMWERFSYYGMRALLVFYLTKHFLMTEEAAYGIYGAYVTLVFMMPVIGGVLADRYLGQRRAVLIGAVLLVLGHAGMAIEGPPVMEGGSPDAIVLNIFYLSLALIVIGVGFLKANISTIVGELYPKTDPRRDSAYTFFYVGINTGAFFGALYAGFLGETFGWRYGFGLAGLGMLAGLIVFIWGKPLLQGAGEPPNPAILKQKRFAGLTTETLIYLGSLAMLLFVWYIIRDQQTVGYLLYTAMATVYAYIIYTSVKSLEPQARDRIFAALFLITIQVLFWALFEQAGSSLNLYTDREVDRQFLGDTVPASVFQSLNAMYIIYFGPLFAAAWVFLNKRGIEPSTPQKFAIGVVLLGLGFLVLVAGANASDGLTPIAFIFLIYLLHTLGELCLSPVGLSAMTRLSIGRMVGLIMGAWFLASGAGNFASGLIAQATASVGPNGESQVLQVYSNVGWLAIIVGGALFVIAPFVARRMHLDTLKDETADAALTS